MVLAFRDWVTWQAFFNSDSRNSSSARAEKRQGEHRWGIPSLNKATPGSLPIPRPSTWPGRPRQDTDDDRHCRRHLPNLFVSLHDLLDPRLGRGQKTRTPSPPSQNGVLGGKTRGGIPGERGRGAPTRGEHGRGRGVRAPEHCDAPAPPPSSAWARASREPGPLLPGPATCSPAGTARYTFSSCSASQGLSCRAGPSAAARSFPAPGPASRLPAAVPLGPGAACSAPAAPHGVLAPPVKTPLSGPGAPSPWSLPDCALRSRPDRHSRRPPSLECER